MSKRNTALYLEDIRSAIDKIEEYSRGLSFKEFKDDFKTIDAIVRNFEIMGEAAARIPEALKEKHASVPWGQIVGIRNKVVHEYFGVDPEIIWKTIKDDLPKLKKSLPPLDLIQ